MLEKGRISASQLGKMVYLGIVPTAILATPTVTHDVAKQDAWISPVWAFSGLIAILVALGFYRLFPHQNFIQVCERIIGRVPGKLLAILFSLYYLYLNGIIVREYGEFVVGAFLHRTPLSVVVGSMVFVCAIAVRGGLEVVARFAELLLPAFITLYLLIVIPIIPELEVLHMFPIMGEGIMPSIKGSFILQSWFCEFIIATFFLPYVSNHQQVKKSLLYALVGVIVSLMITNLVTLLLLGEITSDYIYPFLILARYISLADFYTHVSALFMAVWVFGAFVKICVFFYVTVLSIGQWMDLSSYRPIVFPVALLLVLFSLWAAPNYQVLIDALSTSITFLTLTMLLLVPLVLFSIAWVKKRFVN